MNGSLYKTRVRRNKKQRKSRKFLIGTCIYAAALLILCAVFLLNVRGLLVDFEASQPEKAMDREISLLAEAAARGTLTDVFPLSDDVAGQIKRGALTESYIDCVKNSTLTYKQRQIQTGSTLSYDIYAGELRVAEAVLESHNERTRLFIFPDADWTLGKLVPVTRSWSFSLPSEFKVICDGEIASGTETGGTTAYDICALITAGIQIEDQFGNRADFNGSALPETSVMTFTVPSNFAVTVNGEELPDSFYTQKTMAKYKYISEYCETMPQSRTYTIHYLNDCPPSLKITDNLGNIVSYAPGDILDVESPAAISALPDSFVSQADILKFAEQWSLFMTKDLSGDYYGLNTILKYFIKDSYLAKTAKSWARGIDITFTSIHRLLNPPFKDERAENFIMYSDECFSCEVYLVKRMHIANGLDIDDAIHSVLYWVLRDETDDGIDNPQWYVVDMREIIS